MLLTRLLRIRFKLSASFVRYLLVGLLNTAVGLTLTLLLLNAFDLPYGASALFGSAAGAVLSFALNRAFTFRSRAPLAAALPRFALVSLACCAAAYGLALPLGGAVAPLLQLAAAAAGLGGGAAAPALAQSAAALLGSAIYTVLGYCGHRRYTFRAAPELDAATPAAAPIRAPRRLDRLALLAAALVLASLLLVPPLVGIANNGDFERIMGTVGLAYADPHEPYADRYFRFFHGSYALRGLGLGGYVSSEIPVVLAATLLNRLLYSSAVFDIRFLGAVYAALLLTAMHIILKAIRGAHPLVRAAVAAMFVFVFCDIGYVAYFHSLFGEPVTLVFLLLTLGIALSLARSANAGSPAQHQSPAPSAHLLAAFFASAAFLTAAKTQTAPVGLILAALSFRFRGLRPDLRWRRTWLYGITLLALTSVAIYVSAPKSFKAINQYQSVFYGILYHSPDPAGDLQALGIDPELSVLAGTNYFTPHTPISQRDPRLDELFYSRISHARIALFYATHPHRLFDSLREVAANAMIIRPYYLGNYEQSAAFAPGSLSMKFSLWSDWKHRLLPSTLTFLVLFFAGCAAVLSSYRHPSRSRSVRLAADVLLAVAAIGAVSFLTPLIGDGVADIGKHLFLFDVIFDVLFIGSAGWLVHVSIAAVRAIRGKLLRGGGPIGEGAA